MNKLVYNSPEAELVTGLPQRVLCDSAEMSVFESDTDLVDLWGPEL